MIPASELEAMVDEAKEVGGGRSVRVSPLNWTTSYQN